MFKKLRSTLSSLDKLSEEMSGITQQVVKLKAQLNQLKNDVNHLKLSLGRIENRQLHQLNENKLSSNEFKVFSQWGEDGIIQFLLHHIPVENKIFVEFGVQKYTESNTRFLLINDNWSGLVIDSNQNDINFIKSDSIYWKYNLKAVHAFIAKDNINDLIVGNGIRGEIGLLSVDIDGNDYWVWQAINVVTPAIVIVEYNSRFGKDKALTVPYNEKFVRSQAHYSMIYYGASLKALCQLAQEKGYVFVGSNSAGNNAFFVRKDLKPDWIQELTPEEGYVAGQFRESRDRNGQLSYLSLLEEQEILASLPLVEIE
jgi:hypothetical protein